jgi:hypothetical protein
MSFSVEVDERRRVVVCSGATGDAIAYQQPFSSLAPTPPVTISLWMRGPVSNPGSTDGVVGATLNSSWTGGFSLYFQTGGATPEIRCGWDIYNAEYTSYVFTDGMTAGGWYHVVIQSDGATNWLWVDGVMEDSVSTPTYGYGVQSGWLTLFNISGQQPSSYAFTGGALDDLRIWRRLLTAAEIAHLGLARGIGMDPHYVQLVPQASPPVLTYNDVSMMLV